MSIGGQNALPRGWRLAAASIAEENTAVWEAACTVAWLCELHTTLAGRRSTKNFGASCFGAHLGIFCRRLALGGGTGILNQIHSLALAATTQALFPS
jgi:hypothetical protein